jgi:hypothetical protein
VLELPGTLEERGLPMSGKQPRGPSGQDPLGNKKQPARWPREGGTNPVSPGSPPPLDLSRATDRVFFGIYYVKPGDDGAFGRAAATWMREVQANPDYNPATDWPILKPVTTEGDFKGAWNELYTFVASKPGAVVVQGHLFTHASKEGGANTGLEFMPDRDSDPEDDATLTAAEIRGLPKLPWDTSQGELVLHGCLTGLASKVDGTIPAQVFAQSQGVVTVGQTGSADFSSQDQSYWPIFPIGEGFGDRSKMSKDVYLWAYNKAKHMSNTQVILKFLTPGGYAKLDGIVFFPPTLRPGDWTAWGLKRVNDSFGAVNF